MKTTLSEHISEAFEKDTEKETKNEMNNDNPGDNPSGNEPEDSINESVVTDFISNLSKDEIEMVIGVAGAVGLFGGTYVVSKLIGKLKSSGTMGKKLADKIEKMGAAAGKSTQKH